MFLQTPARDIEEGWACGPGVVAHFVQGQVSALLPVRPEAPQVSESANGAVTNCHANPSHVIPAVEDHACRTSIRQH